MHIVHTQKPQQYCSSDHSSLSNLQPRVDFVGLVGCFNSDIFPLFDSTPCASVLSLLIQSLQKLPSIAESHSQQLVPLFFSFLGYSADETRLFYI